MSFLMIHLPMMNLNQTNLWILNQHFRADFRIVKTSTRIFIEPLFQGKTAALNGDGSELSDDTFANDDNLPEETFEKVTRSQNCS